MSAGLRPHPNRLLLFTLVGLMQAFWTANFIVGKVALREFPAPLLVGLRLLLAAALIAPLYAWRAPAERRWTRRDLPMLILLGIVGVGVNQLFFIMGLGRTSVAHCSILIAMTPISVLLIGASRGIERVTAGKLVGMLVAMAGVGVLSFESGAGRSASLAGDLLTLAGGTAFAVYTVFGQEINHRYDALAVNTVLYASAAVFLLPMVLWQGWSFPFRQVSAAGWASLLYMAVFPSLFCYMIFYYALGYIQASRLATLAYIQPVVATLGGVLLFGEPVSASLLAGGAIILGGVCLAERA